MDVNLNSLRERLIKLVSEKEDKETREHEELEEQMVQLAKREGIYSSLAEQLFRDVLEPRLKLLEEYTTDSKYEISSRDYCGSVVFNIQGKYNASFKLEMGIDCDPQIKKFYVIYRLRIIPILMPFDREDSLAIPLEEVTLEKVVQYVDDMLIKCIETYMQFQKVSYYKKARQVTDPVCGMTLHELDVVSSAEFESMTYYFCANHCKARFLENPSLYTQSTLP